MNYSNSSTTVVCCRECLQRREVKTRGATGGVHRRPRLAESRPVGAAFALLGAACGGDLYPVSGKAVYSDGTPVVELAGGHVLFDSPGARTARGAIQTGCLISTCDRQTQGRSPAWQIPCRYQAAPSSRSEHLQFASRHRRPLRKPVDIRP